MVNLFQVGLGEEADVYQIDGSPTLVEFVEKLDVAISGYFQHTGEMRPTYHIVVGDAMVVLDALPLPKEIATPIMRKYLEHVEATRVVFVDECWLLSLSLETEEQRAAAAERIERARREGAQQDADRIEAILYAAECAVEGSRMAQRVITRDAEGRPTLGPLTWMPEGGKMEGRIVGLLPRKGAVQ